MNELAIQKGRFGPFRDVLSRLAAPFFCSRPDTISVRSGPKKILIVDDDPVILKTISSKLGYDGYSVVTAQDGSEAIGAVRDAKPDLIVLDINFPPDVGAGGRVTWDGFQIMSWLRGLNEANCIPFIIITSGDPALYRERSLASGATAFFQKPIQHDHLLRVIMQVLEDDHRSR